MHNSVNNFRLLNVLKGYFSLFPIILLCFVLYINNFLLNLYFCILFSGTGLLNCVQIFMDLHFCCKKNFMFCCIKKFCCCETKKLFQKYFCLVKEIWRPILLFEIT